MTTVLHTNKYSSTHHRAMCSLRAGGYDIDKTPPEPMDLPEVCAFGAYGLLGLIRTECSTEIIVLRDERFGVIPVCTKHRRLARKESIDMDENKIVEFYLRNVLTKFNNRMKRATDILQGDLDDIQERFGKAKLEEVYQKIQSEQKGETWLQDINPMVRK